MVDNMQQPSEVHSILAADFGSVNTRVVLIDLVDGQYRLVSRAQNLTTADPPIGDVTVGLFRALEQMSSLIGRRFINRDQLIIGELADHSGADLFIATASGGRPMRAVLVGLMPDVSLASGRRALGSTYVDLTDVLSLGDIRTQEEQVNAILRTRPDLIFIVGGTDNGAADSILALLNTIKLAVTLLPPESRPVVLYAGNEALQPQVKALLDDDTRLFISGNVRPSLNDERLGGAQLELALVYGAYKSNNTAFSEVQSLSRMGLLPTANSYGVVLRYLGELADSGMGVMCVDVGSSTVTICTTIRKKPSISIRPDLGLGHSAVSSVEKIGVQNIIRWLTFAAKPSDVMDYAWNKSLHPGTVPQTVEDLEMEYALTRELIRAAVETSRQAWQGMVRGNMLPPLRPIIGAGAVLAQALDPGISAMLLLDALQPTGVTELKLDPYGIIPALGGIAYLQPLAMVQVLESGGLLDLGTAICPEGRATTGNAMDVTVKYATGRTVKRTVPVGGLRTIDLPSGQKATVTIRLGRGLTLNGKRGTVSFAVEGGATGIILDGRGRPLVVPTDITRRKELIPRWYAAVRSTSRGSVDSEASVVSASGSSTKAQHEAPIEVKV